MGARALIRSCFSTRPVGSTPRSVHSDRSAPGFMASSCTIVNVAGSLGFSAAAPGPPWACASLFWSLLWLLLRSSSSSSSASLLVVSRRRRLLRRPSSALPARFLFLFPPRRFRPPALSPLPSRLLLGLGLRSQSPAAHRSKPLGKLGAPSIREPRTFVLRDSSARISASTSPVPSCCAFARSASMVSRSRALRRKTCFCEGHGSMAISTAEAVASSRRDSAGSCRARSIISRMKKPQS
mmetsp:Transcript_21527/g.56131  ORF Transcript_21527/g.56131 Transcript_21527/m.56131 type:complete len:239 (+) Transcript_21527:276-992(+)